MKRLCPEIQNENLLDWKEKSKEELVDKEKEEAEVEKY